MEERNDVPRVITGTARGTLLRTPRGSITRPTPDRVKEALFSILSDRVYDATMLDLFAGSGQMGIEALSRGAGSVVFVDSASESIECIRTNLEKTRLSAKALVRRSDVVSMLSTLSQDGGFDLVYMDPPYADAVRLFREIAGILTARSLLAPGGMVMVEHPAQDLPEDFVTKLKLMRRCKYGTVMISFYGRYDNDN
jgi:16S rRNA (guanine966-N2)-methyltransferase